MKRVDDDIRQVESEVERATLKYTKGLDNTIRLIGELNTMPSICSYPTFRCDSPVAKSFISHSLNSESYNSHVV